MNTILITGAANRIGKGLALNLAKAGHTIALHYNTSKHAAHETLQSLKSINPECQVFQADLTNHKNCQTLINQVTNTFPDLTTLINNASHFEKASFNSTTETQFNKHIDLNVKAPFFLSQEFCRHPAAKNIINILDSYIVKNTHPYFAYLLSKKALAQQTEMLAASLTSLNINAIAPGITEYPDPSTDITKIKNPITVKAITNTVLSLIRSNKSGKCIYLKNGDIT